MTSRSYLDRILEENRSLRAENEKLRALVWSSYLQLTQIHRMLTDSFKVGKHSSVLKLLRSSIFGLKHGPNMQLDQPETHGFKKLRHQLLRVSAEDMAASYQTMLDSDSELWYKSQCGNSATYNKREEK